MLTPEAFNVFVPAHHPVVGPARDLDGLRTYVTTAMARMAELGAALVVFGSGPARGTPPGFDHHQVPGQLLEFLRLAGELADRQGLDVVIEPLFREKCDNINTVVEGYVAARQSGHPRVWVLADWWHMLYNEEPLSNLDEAKDRLRHVHVPVPPLPDKPEQPTDAGYGDFLQALHHQAACEVDIHGVCEVHRHVGQAEQRHRTDLLYTGQARHARLNGEGEQLFHVLGGQPR